MTVRGWRYLTLPAALVGGNPCTSWTQTNCSASANDRYSSGCCCDYSLLSPVEHPACGALLAASVASCNQWTQVSSAHTHPVSPWVYPARCHGHKQHARDLRCGRSSFEFLVLHFSGHTHSYPQLPHRAAEDGCRNADDSLSSVSVHSIWSFDFDVGGAREEPLSCLSRVILQVSTRVTWNPDAQHCGTHPNGAKGSQCGCYYSSLQPPHSHFAFTFGAHSRVSFSCCVRRPRVLADNKGSASRKLYIRDTTTQLTLSLPPPPGR